ncbi:hypothetical protein CRG98_028366 [Punica granatum]|uniref:Xylanase inhibitor N-terminal domain-containing protein n=1 Tax=Punica granatum TaxID=22663 RepID=A0A2I0J4R7_PUNGR|nr:hypothetical protein CRG98_028366 [Punica granatum]
MELTVSDCSAPPAIPNLRNYAYGCAWASIMHNNTGSFIEIEMGLIGLGKGSASSISQVRSSFGARRFSQHMSSPVPHRLYHLEQDKLRVGHQIEGPGSRSDLGSYGTFAGFNILLLRGIIWHLYDR